MTARFAPVDLSADISTLPPNERQALAKLVEAAQVFDALFLRQVWAGNETMLLSLLGDTSELGRARLHYFLINKGPWSRLDHNEPFVPGAPPKPPQGNFYPAGRDEGRGRRVDQDAAAGRAHAGDRLLHDDPPGPGRPASPPCRTPSNTRARSSSVADAAARGRGADDAADAEGVSRAPRGRDLISNDYYASDVAWMELDASIEPTIGPYEVYEDEWFNYKAAFEAFITIRDDEETNKLDAVRSRAAGDREQPADRPEVPQPEARRDGADPRRQYRVLVRRRATAACRRRRSTCPTTSA